MQIHPAPTQLNDVRLIGWPELSKHVPYTRQHILRLEKKGRFPRRVTLGEARIAWVEAEIVAWINDRKQARVTFGAAHPTHGARS